MGADLDAVEAPLIALSADVPYLPFFWVVCDLSPSGLKSDGTELNEALLLEAKKLPQSYQGNRCICVDSAASIAMS